MSLKNLVRALRANSQTIRNLTQAAVDEGLISEKDKSDAISQANSLDHDADRAEKDEYYITPKIYPISKKK